MENVVFTLHLILALGLICTVLLQRSEGGGFGSGSAGGLSAGRPPVNAVAKFTWGLAVAFIMTSIWLTIIAAQNSAGGSVLDRVIDRPQNTPTETAPGSDLLPSLPQDDIIVPRAE